ncbi:DUF3422 domain-containing protein [Mycobacterium sp.]|uniref:DUF3422 domain-containing protein n=1 Tax=Mycobacterium sp. TaxID=1785 RepID=UPI00128524EA|nr:DUF3422 domain-containing protein [Mycobacterium sp.]KAA8962738.1 MAG: DUF3422 domain-containing protein [Mycobacterium sp.]
MSGSGLQATVTLPPDAPERAAAHHEVHVRPVRPLPVPSMTTQLTVLTEKGSAPAETAHLQQIAGGYGKTVRDTDTELTIDFDEVTALSWERHDSYSLYTIYQPFNLAKFDPQTDLLSQLPLPAGWLAGIPGRTLAAVHAVLLPAYDWSEDAASQFAHRTLGSGRLLGSRLRGDAARLYTTYQLSPTKTSRFLMLCNPMTEGRAGRITASLLDVERYRMLALVAYPQARALLSQLVELEARLTELTRSIEDERRDDRGLLDELIKLAAVVEYDIAAHVGHFDAARAYYAIVEQRIEYLRGSSLPGLMGVFTFLRRRLVPAMATVAAATQRMEGLSGRVARTADVLRTRVEVNAELQTQQLLRGLRRGQTLQLRLQQTVEGLSIAAISYYIVGLVGYLAKGIKSLGLAVNESAMTALSIPLAIILVWHTVRRVRRQVHDVDRGDSDDESPSRPGQA